MLRVIPELKERPAGVDARLLGARTVMAKRRLGLRVELGARRGGRWEWSLPARSAADRRADGYRGWEVSGKGMGRFSKLGCC